ncbi:Chromosome (plasmid) partitioning protein ParB [Vibrio chagasii]|nr:Chromosome (plasmid) partitioning protein ParB [Vibrio chagasii]
MTDVKVEQAKKGFASGTANLLKELNRKVDDATKKGVTVEVLTEMVGDKVPFVASLMSNKIESGLPFPLSGNRSVIFDLVEIPWDQIESRTIPHDVNDREQEALTEESLSDIIPLLSKQGNTSPAYANLLEDTDVLEIVDGSRRRMSCVLAKVPYRVFVAREHITLEDAKYLDKIGQASKPLSYREIGIARLVEWERVDDDGARVYQDRKSLAVALFGGEYTDSEYQMLVDQLRFAAISQKLLSLVPNYNSLTVAQYKKISKFDSLLAEYAQGQQMDVVEVLNRFATESTENLNVVRESNTDSAKLTKELIDELENLVYSFISVEVAPTIPFVPLVEFTSRKKRAQKREAGNTLTFKFSHLGKRDSAKIEAAILEVLGTLNGVKDGD